MHIPHVDEGAGLRAAALPCLLRSLAAVHGDADGPQVAEAWGRHMGMCVHARQARVILGIQLGILHVIADTAAVMHEV